MCWLLQSPNWTRDHRCAPHEGFPSAHLPLRRFWCGSAGLWVRGSCYRVTLPWASSKNYSQTGQKPGRTALKPGKEDRFLNFNEDMKRGILESSWWLYNCWPRVPLRPAPTPPGAEGPRQVPWRQTGCRRWGGHLGRRGVPECRTAPSTGSWRAGGPGTCFGNKHIFIQSLILHPFRQPFSIPCDHTRNTRSHTLLRSTWLTWPLNCLGF